MDSQPKFTRSLEVVFSLALFRFEKVYSKRSLNFDINAHIEWKFFSSPPFKQSVVDTSFQLLVNISTVESPQIIIGRISNRRQKSIKNLASLREKKF